MKHLNTYTIRMLIFLVTPINIFCHSKTFFTPRQITFDSTYNLAQINYNFYHGVTKDCPLIYFYVTPFFQTSTHDAEIARYFLPNNKCVSSLREDGLGNIGSLWLNIISKTGTSYNSLLTLRPKQQVYGSILQFYFTIPHCENQFWVNATTAIVCMRHAINMRETNHLEQGTVNNFANACQALNSPCLNAGKFSPCNLNLTGVDDIQIKCGYNYFFWNDNHLGIYLVGGIPTGNRPRSKYIFEPIIGSKSGSLGVGLNCDYNIFNRCEHSIHWMSDFKYRTVFKTHERRSFDLCKNGDWSRYLQVVTAKDLVFSTPAINVLTADVNVTPGSTIDFWMAFNYNHRQCNIEIGYNLWWRQQEKVSLKCPFPNNFAIYDIVGNCQGDPVSASNAMINESVIGPNLSPSDKTFAPFDACDLNLHSAEHPNALSNKIYVAFSYNSIIQCTPILAGVGISYEIGHSYSTLSNVGILGNIAFNF